MRILVTGGAGFLGTNLCETLLAQQHEVVCVDNLVTGKKTNLTQLLTNPLFTCIEKNITEADFLTLPGHFDQIYHLACPASPPKYQAKQIATLHTSSIGTDNVIKLALKNNARVLFSSTSEVYGSPLEHPQKETYWGNVNPIGIRSCYDEGKRFSEALFFAYHRELQLNMTIVRIFNTYGPYMDPYDGRVVSNFIMQALQGEALTLYGDGKQTRSFCYVDDLVHGMIAMMESTQVGPVNLGNPAEFTVQELAETILSLIPTTSKIEYQSLPLDDPIRRNPNITLAKELLQWTPQISLRDGLQKTIPWFQNFLQGIL